MPTAVSFFVCVMMIGPETRRFRQDRTEDPVGALVVEVAATVRCASTLPGAGVIVTAAVSGSSVVGGGGDHASAEAVADQVQAQCRLCRAAGAAARGRQPVAPTVPARDFIW